MINTDLIKNLRENLGKTPYQFAKDIGIDLKTYEAMERGESVTLNTLDKVAKKFNLGLRDLVK